MKLFNLVRYEDETGVSGTGVVAKGVILPSGKAVMEWVTEYKSIATYDSIGELEAIHGHGGKTKVEYIEEKIFFVGDTRKTYKEKLEQLIEEKDLNVCNIQNISTINEKLYKDIYNLLEDFRPRGISLYAQKYTEIQSVSILARNGELHIDIAFKNGFTDTLYIYHYKTTNKSNLEFYNETRFMNFYEED